MSSGRHALDCRAFNLVNMAATNRHFFVGGAVELNDVASLHIPTDHFGPVLSKLGWKTVNGPTIKATLNTARQWPTGAAPAPTNVRQVLGALKTAPAATATVVSEYTRIAERVRELTNALDGNSRA
eukprot:TRINITY_DN9655_c0_g1_i2.p4 TRINITY_DN9655_c0_g1~~TRINITY_DN9655_c0_g1_i2.p4  ORF type:complete len:126 (+),score=19.32 TRINITY_DN9655_c0_g1_i2:1307-1684(+)